MFILYSNAHPSVLVLDLHWKKFVNYFGKLVIDSYKANLQKLLMIALYTLLSKSAIINKT